MFRLPIFGLAWALALLSVAGGIGNSRDVSTYANIDEVYTTHLALDFAVDFDRSVFDGYVELTMNTTKDGVTSVWLDAEGLDVLQVDYVGMNGGCFYW
jgi:aminopeptidase N